MTFFEGKGKFQVLILFEHLLIYFLIVLSLVFIDFKIRKNGLALTHFLSLKCLWGMGTGGGNNIFLPLQLLNLDIVSEPKKGLKRENINVEILLTEMTCPTYKSKKICAQRLLKASEPPSVSTTHPNSEFYYFCSKFPQNC